MPVSEYGKTKLAGTRLVVDAAADGGLDAVVLRIFNPIGPGTPPSSVLGHASRGLRTAARSGAHRIHLGPLDAYRDYVHVDDAAVAIVRAAERRSGESVLNVGRGQAVQTRALVRMLADIAGFDGEIVEDRAGSSRSNHVAWQRAEVGRIARVLGWQATTDLRESLALLWSEPDEFCQSATTRAFFQPGLSPSGEDRNRPVT
jgi:NDP-hexose 4-ketoreductase